MAQVKVESMLFHPTANNVRSTHSSAHMYTHANWELHVHNTFVQVLASAGGPSAKVWDIERAVLLFGELD